MTMSLLKKVLEPVLNEDGEPHWLSIFEEKHSLGNPRPIKEIIKEDCPMTTIKRFKLVKQGIWICNKCCAEVYSPENQPEICTQCNRASTFKVSTETINPDFWTMPIWRDVEPGNTYQDIDSLLRKVIIFPEEIHYKIYNLDIHSSYFMDEWEAIGYLAFIGMIESGKSRGLDLIAKIGYRMMNAGSGMSFPAMVRGAHFFGAGVLLDEAQDKLTTKTEKGQEMIDFIKPGYRRGSHYMVADKEDQKKIISYNNYGFKAFASEREFGHAIMSRCKTIEMEQDFPEITNLREIKTDLENIQTRLMNLKLKFEGIIPELPFPIELRGRSLEIFTPTIRMAQFLGIPYQDIIDYAKKRRIDEMELMKDSDECAVLALIKGREENARIFDAPEHISYGDIISLLDWEQTEHQSPNQKLGYIVKKRLHLATKRMNNGTVILLNDMKNIRRLEYYYRRYEL